MAGTLDPYHVWLGIAPKDQPPNHYRLLSLDLFEADPDVIQNAADRQMAHLRTFQAGKHGALSQKILNEVAAAKICLLSPQKKDAYDQQLRGRLQPAPPRPPGLPPPLESLAKGEAFDPGLAELCATAVASRSRPRSAGRKRAVGRRPSGGGRQSLAAVAGIGVVALACCLAILKKPAAEKHQAAGRGFAVELDPGVAHGRAGPHHDRDRRPRLRTPDRLAEGRGRANCKSPMPSANIAFDCDDSASNPGSGKVSSPKGKPARNSGMGGARSARGRLGPERRWDLAGRVSGPQPQGRVTAVPATPFEITRIGLRDAKQPGVGCRTAAVRAL